LIDPVLTVFNSDTDGTGSGLSDGDAAFAALHSSSSNNNNNIFLGE